MQQDSTATAWGAIALGVVCVVGTMVILFWEFVEKWSLSGFNQTHVYILLALAVAYVTGHLTFESRGGWRVAFCMLFAVGTVICVGLSGARTSESMDRREGEVADAAGKRARLVKRIADADAARKAARTAADKAAADGKAAIDSAAADGKTSVDRAAADLKAAAKLAAEACKKGVYCKRQSEASERAQKVLSEASERATHALSEAQQYARVVSIQAEKRAQDAEDHHRDLSGQLNKLKAPVAANAAMHKLATILTLGYGGESVLPYLFALLTEFGSVASFTYGFRLLMSRSAAIAETVSEVDRKPSRGGAGGPPRGGRKPRKPTAVLGSAVNRQPPAIVVNGPWRVKSMNEPKALAFVQARLASGGEFPSQDAIAAHVGVTKSAVSKWAGRWERQGLVAREKDGRCKVVSLPMKASA